MTQEANAPAANPRFGRYEILEEIGSGGMGVVYRALDPTIGRTVAVKTVRLTEQGAADEVQELRARLVRESQAAGQLSHPNIIPIFDFGEQQDVAYIVMEYIAGRTLDQALMQDPAMRSPDVALNILADCARALDYAHSKGIVHRDIKPQNIMLQADGSVKIADFGIAKVLQGTTMTRTSMLVGSPQYMAPEQLKAEAITGRTDQYALATMAYMILTGRRPFESESMVSLITKTLYEDPPLVPALNPALPEAVDGVLRRGLAKNPEARFASCAEFVQALRVACSAPVRQNVSSAMADATRLAVQTPLPTPIPAYIPTPTPAPPLPQPAPAQKSKARWLVLIAGLIVAAGLVSASVYVYQVNQASQVELAYWDSVKDSKNAGLYESYIERYPKGQFVRLAKTEIAALQAQRPVPLSAPPPSAVAAAPAAAPVPPPIATATNPPLAKRVEPGNPAKPAFTASCKPGLVEFVSDKLQACVAMMAANGYSPATAATYKDGDELKMLLVFQHPADRRITTVNVKQREQEFLSMVANGQRVDSVSVTHLGPAVMYTTIWTPRESQFQYRPGIMKDFFEKERVRLETDGYMIVDLAPFRARNQVHYSVVWLKQPGLDTKAIDDLTPPDLDARDRTLNQQGYRMWRITGYPGDAGLRYAAVWRKSSAKSVWRIGLNRDALLKLHAEMIDRGFHLLHVNAVGDDFPAVWGEGR